jgi:hypothetical protein
MRSAFATQDTAGSQTDPAAAVPAYPPHFVLEYAPDLLEAVLLHVLRNHLEEHAFRQQRDPLYELPDPEAREASFNALHTAWFTRLGLGQVIDHALRDLPLLLQHTLGGKIMRACTPRDEGAELFVSPTPPLLHSSTPPLPAGRCWVVLRLRPERFAAPAQLLEFLRRELLHIADMLDPAFGYQPTLPFSDAGPMYERLLRDRYRVLWDTSIDGRLVRRGWAPLACHTLRLWEFRQTFPMLGQHTEEALARFFHGEAVTHAELVRFACAPEAFLAHPAGALQQGDRCPLCRFPTHAFEPEPAQLSGAVVQRIRADFPAWEPGQGMCQQCAALYRARAAQRAASVPIASGPV